MPHSIEVGGLIGTASAEKDGLMPRIEGRSPFYLYKELNKGETINFGFDYGIISLRSSQYGTSWLFILTVTNVSMIAKNGGNIMTTEPNAQGTVNIYKTQERVLVIQNNTSDQFRFYIEAI